MFSSSFWEGKQVQQDPASTDKHVSGIPLLVCSIYKKNLRSTRQGISLGIWGSLPGFKAKDSPAPNLT